MSGLDDAREDYADENLPVFLLLGLVSALRRLEPLLPPGEPPHAGPEAAASPTPDALPGSASLLHLVLGLIVFRRHLLAALAAAAPEGPREAATDMGSSLKGPQLSPRELLR